jgi:peptidyl-prolyl cis-trans isomerase C
MSQPVRRLLREPLSWFALLGALIYFGVGGGPGADSAPAGDEAGAEAHERETIAVSAAQRARLRADFVGRHGRAPSEEQEAALVRSYALEEALYREALRLRLDEGDLIVRRRLVQKLRFITEEGVALELGAPPEAELTARIEAALAGAPATPRRYTFEQRFFRDAGSAAAADPATDPGEPFPHGARFIAASRADIARRFGASFAEAVAATPVGAWSAPIQSSYGAHRVLLSAIEAPEETASAALRARVEAEWRDEAPAPPALSAELAP